MTQSQGIPVFTLFGETGQFPDVVHCEGIRDRAPDHGWVISPHRHSQMSQLFIIQSGGAEAQIDGQSLPLHCGELLFVPAQSVHGFVFAPGTEGWVLSFPLSLQGSLGPASPEAAQALGRCVHAPVPDRLMTLVGLLDQTLTGAGTFRAQEAAGLAHAVLAQVATLGAGAQGPGMAPASGVSGMSGVIDRLDRLIAQNLGAGWGPAAYAAALSVSTGHLSRLCRATRGIGAAAYIESCTMTEACRLLAFTQMPVAAVGYRLGYDDPSYFSRRFRARQGQTPSEYRAAFVG